MKLEDLMIGNHVLFPHGIDTVVELAYDESARPYVSFAASATIFHDPLDKVKPIPLTKKFVDDNDLDGRFSDGCLYKNNICLSSVHEVEQYLKLEKKTKVLKFDSYESK